MKSRWKKALLAVMVLVPGLAYAGIQIAESWCGSCPICP